MTIETDQLLIRELLAEDDKGALELTPTLIVLKFLVNPPITCIEEARFK